jgi:hypothetical protein
MSSFIGGISNSTSSKACLKNGSCSYSSLPILRYCDPCPENKNDAIKCSFRENVPEKNAVILVCQKFFPSAAIEIAGN